MSKADTAVLEEFNFEFSAPPARSHTRKGKHYERWVAARALCEKNPGSTLKVMEYKNQGSAYQTAKSINNGEHRVFLADAGNWTAVAAPLPPFINEDDEEESREGYGVWLTYTPHDDEE
jgi:hypothetical protein